AAGAAVAVFRGGGKVESGELRRGDLILVMGYLAMLYQPVQLLSKSIGMTQSALASAARVFALLDEAPDVVEKPGARALRRAAGAVAFRGVSFAYGGDSQVLRDVSFEGAPGARVRIVRATGAGQTTPVRL